MIYEGNDTEINATNHINICSKAKKVRRRNGHRFSSQLKFSSFHSSISLHWTTLRLFGYDHLTVLFPSGCSQLRVFLKK